MEPPALGPGLKWEEIRAYLNLLARLRPEQQLQGKVDLSGVVQQTLLETHQSIDRFQQMSEGERAVWLREIFGNNIRDEARKYRTAGRDVERECPLEGDLEDSSTPSGKVIRSEDELRVAWALEQLPDDERTVLELYFWKGCKRVEIARQMKVERKKVTRRLEKGLQTLRTLLGERGQE
ncbi:MAG TPA: sigma-70 family RNA polymerase sigma factor [Gemmataceae bacterium]|nr:sigma-70 family RNA polymerase sigma factor [Gemmataceae bacterium]